MSCILNGLPRMRRPCSALQFGCWQIRLSSMMDFFPSSQAYYIMRERHRAQCNIFSKSQISNKLHTHTCTLEIERENACRIIMCAESVVRMAKTRHCIRLIGVGLAVVWRVCWKIQFFFSLAMAKIDFIRCQNGFATFVQGNGHNCLAVAHAGSIAEMPFRCVLSTPSRMCGNHKRRI